MGETALIVAVPAAEPVVADLRACFDPAAAEGIAAHVTVLVPFMPLNALEADGAAALTRLRSALQAVPAFDFSLARVGRFAQTAWLAPEPAAPFVALTQAVMRAFPDWLPYGGAHEFIVPHLTAADGHAAASARVAAELEARLARQGPIPARCDAVDLLENRGPASGWRRVHRIALPAEAPPLL